MAIKNKMEFCFAVRMRMFPSHRQEVADFITLRDAVKELDEGVSFYA